MKNSIKEVDLQCISLCASKSPPDPAALKTTSVLCGSSLQASPAPHDVGDQHDLASSHDERPVDLKTHPFRPQRPHPFVGSLYLAYPSVFDKVQLVGQAQPQGQLLKCFSVPVCTAPLPRPLPCLEAPGRRGLGCHCDSKTNLALCLRPCLRGHWVLVPALGG